MRDRVKTTLRNAVRYYGLYTLAGIFILFVAGAPILDWGLSDDLPENTVPYSTFMSDARSGAFETVTVHGTKLVGSYPDDASRDDAVTAIPDPANALAALDDVPAEIRVERSSGSFFDAVKESTFLLVMATILVILIAITAGGSRSVWSRGRSDTTFADVAGAEQPKQDLKEIVTLLDMRRRGLSNGARQPRGVLMSGPPGTGKTLLARALAGEADVPLFQASGANFDDKFVGVGAQRIRDLFRAARRAAERKGGAVIFIDEFDALAKERINTENRYHQQTINQLLTEMDGFERSQNVIVLAATNAPHALDPAVTRAGRFDRKVTVPLPDTNERRQILDVHARSVSMADDVDMDALARSTTGFSGADLEQILNEAALLAGREDRHRIAAADIEAARDRTLMGAPRSGAAMTDDEKRVVAHHEAGHAVVGVLLPHADDLHKVTIVPRGNGTGGHAAFLPEHDRQLMTRAHIRSRLTVLCGGRAAEELMYGPEGTTNGAANDLQVATRLAREMVASWGLHKQGQTLAVYGQQGVQPSDHRAARLDRETEAILNRAMTDAFDLLKENWSAFQEVADALHRHETLSGAEVRSYVGGRPEADAA